MVLCHIVYLPGSRTYGSYSKAWKTTVIREVLEINDYGTSQAIDRSGCECGGRHGEKEEARGGGETENGGTVDYGRWESWIDLLLFSTAGTTESHVVHEEKRNRSGETHLKKNQIDNRQERNPFPIEFHTSFLFAVVSSTAMGGLFFPKTKLLLQMNVCSYSQFTEIKDQRSIISPRSTILPGPLHAPSRFGWI